VNAPLTDFAPTDSILAPFADSVSFNAAMNVLTLNTNGHAEGTLTFAGDLSGVAFHDHYGSNQIGTIAISAGHG
jgi:hypothetical protein